MSTNEFPYLIALALIEKDGKRALPLGGKSLTKEIKQDEDPGQAGENLAKDLLLRIFQQSEDVPIQRAAGDLSLLLVQIGIEDMQNKIPVIKAEWIRSGDKGYFLSELRESCKGVWSLSYTKDGGAKFSTHSQKII